MKLSAFLTVKAIVCFVFAVCELLLTATLVSMLGGRADAWVVFMTRTVGATFVGIGLICWFARKAAHSELRQGVLLALFIADSIGFLVSLLAQISGVTNTLGWGIVLIWLLLAAGLGYFRFVKPAA